MQARHSSMSSRVVRRAAGRCAHSGSRRGRHHNQEARVMEEQLRRIDHIGIAVPDLEAAVAAFEQLFGTGPSSIEEVADQKVRTAFFTAGDTDLELLEPTSADSPISNFLAKRGAGIHHVCFEVEDIERALADYRARGVRLIDSTPRIGAHGKRIAFLHPKSTGGILVEICQVAHQRAV
jgi:methylmalonyl-CoA/ethylmalonyl-CoA epimerase